MIVKKLIAELASRGVHVAVQGDKLRVRAPEGAITTELRATMSEQRDALFAYLSDGDHDEPYLLASGQRRLWVLERLRPGEPTYNVMAGFRLEGRLDVAALKASFAQIVSRHGAFRTRFEEIDGEPIAFVSPKGRVDLRVVEILGVPRSERDAMARRHMAAEGREPFDLVAGRVARATLFRFAEDDHVFVVVQHHIVTDGFSLGVIAQELASLYKDGSAPAPAMQYADYAHREAAWLRGDAAEAKRAYWRKQLEKLPALQLPTGARGLERDASTETSILFQLPK
ncbi:MAG TPA: condensation domain-containing protein, partial [Labilithrix sp.]|nr:condensation domain-containing protein [Labilithrix sp.]